MAKRSNPGFDLLDKEDRNQDPEINEKIETQNRRTADSFDEVLTDLLKAKPGGYVDIWQVIIPVPGSSYPRDVQYDRFYFGLKLLVDFFSKPQGSTDAVAQEKERIDKEIADKKSIAQSRGFSYLPIIGSASIHDIASALRIQAAA